MDAFELNMFVSIDYYALLIKLQIWLEKPTINTRLCDRILFISQFYDNTIAQKITT